MQGRKRLCTEIARFVPYRVHRSSELFGPLPCGSTYMYHFQLCIIRIAPQKIDGGFVHHNLDEMSESSFNPINVLSNLLGGSSSSRLSHNIASIHNHVSQELEPDFFTEWQKGEPQRHRSDTTKSSSSSLFSNLTRESSKTSRMWSALEYNEASTSSSGVQASQPVSKAT
ncbi:hypothetical protein R6Q59_010122 [Mikania micrantha]